MSLFLRPSSSSKCIPNTFLRQKRKHPRYPYKTKWDYLFAQQQAMTKLRALAAAASSDGIAEDHQEVKQNETPKDNKPPYLLSCLITAFNGSDCEPTPTAYQFVLRTLTQNSNFNEAGLVLAHMETNEDFETPEKLFVHLIRVYGRKGLFQEAIDLFFRIPNFRCVPTVISLNALLSILSRSEEGIRMVPEILARSQRMRVRINSLTFSTLIDTLCRIGKVDQAIKLIKYMTYDGFTADDKVYSSVLSSLCNKSEEVGSSGVLGFLEAAKSQGFCPGREDYANVIKFLGKENKGLKALSVLGEMKTEGIKPDIISYTVAIRGAIENEEFARAENLFDEILVFGLVPSLITYNVYMNGLCKQGKVEAGYKLICCMEETGCTPDSNTYNMVLEGFHGSGELKRAREVWTEMKLKGLHLNLQTYCLMLDVIVREGDFLGACSFLDELLEENFIPRSSTINHLISGLCQGGCVSGAINVLEKLAARGVGFDDRSWEAVLYQLKITVTNNNRCFDDYVSRSPLDD